MENWVSIIQHISSIVHPVFYVLFLSVVAVIYDLSPPYIDEDLTLKKI
jgi:hypothetical protein